MIRQACWCLAGLSLTFLATSANAQEETKYSYDALGRLTDISTSGGVNSGVATSIKYDAAGNRTNYAVSGSANTGPDTGGGASAPRQAMVIVVPLNGFTVIPIQ